jgi:hypothetical protein
MARARPARTSIPEQLTLEDWAKMLKGESCSSGDANWRGDERRPYPSASAAEKGAQQPSTCAQAVAEIVRHHPVAKELLQTPGALLTRTHLRELGLERRAIDAVFRKLPVISLPGYSRPMIHVEQYLELIRENTYRDDRVRPSHA